MLSVTSRILREVSFDPAENRFLGRVELAFQGAADEAPLTARLSVGVTLPPRARFTQIEAALLDEAQRLLIARLATLDPGPSNLFRDGRARDPRLAA